MGFKCPRCGKDKWKSGEAFWNLWICQWCGGICTIQNGVMDIYAGGGGTDGTDDEKAEAALRKRQAYRYPSQGTD